MIKMASNFVNEYIFILRDENAELKKQYETLRKEMNLWSLGMSDKKCETCGRSGLCSFYNNSGPELLDELSVFYCYECKKYCCEYCSVRVPEGHACDECNEVIFVIPK